MSYADGMYFSEASIYSVEPSSNPQSEWPGEIALRQQPIHQHERYATDQVDARRYPGKYQLAIDDLEPYDLVLFTNLFDTNGVYDDTGFVVISNDLAVQSDVVEANPGKYATRELMSKIEAIGIDEFSQFNLPKLTEYAFKNLASRYNINKFK